jgi:DNA-binding transcriptional LysR family regulator
LDVKVGRSRELADDVLNGTLDLALAAGGLSSLSKALGQEPMTWVAAEGFELDPNAPVPLVVFDAPCPFRDSALATLNACARSWDIRYTSPSLSGVRAAVAAGLGITVRTGRLLKRGLVEAPPHFALPTLPHVKFAIYARDEKARPPIAAMAAEIKDAF